MFRRIDAKGKNCPIPVVMARQAISDGETAFTIEVDHQTAVENLKRLAVSQGYTVAVRAEGDGFALTFIKDGETPVIEADLPLPLRRYAVFAGRDVLGAGERELGTNLMRMFFYTLAGSDDLPAFILLINDGVKLAVLDEQVSEHLQTLQRKGVEVLVCGTCLSYYGLTGRLRTGTVSNMYEILSRMQACDKVITL